MWDAVVLIPDHCLSIYFDILYFGMEGHKAAFHTLIKAFNGINEEII